MELIQRRNNFTPPSGVMPDLSLIQLPEPRTVAASALNLRHIRPKLLVRENDTVRTGSPLFHDKRRPEIQYLSPGTGTVEKIVFGLRRRLEEVVIRLDRTEQFVQFDPIQADQLQTLSGKELAEKLQQGGLWQCFRAMPYEDTADETQLPPMILVSLNGRDPASPHPGILLEQWETEFQTGLKLLKAFTDRVVVISKKNSLPRLNLQKQHVTHVTSNTYPDWDPGVVLYNIKQNATENRAWHISAEHLTLLVRFLLTGRYPVKRMVTVARGEDCKPHILTRQGAPVAHIIGNLKKNAVITTGRFNGHLLNGASHLGFFDTTLNVIDNREDDQLFGFIRPGLNTPTASKTFLSALFNPSSLKPDANLHGEERACINCGYCTRICPVELMPNFIVKALLSDDIEDALSYGLWDCVRCGLCTYACPSKIELNHILSQGMDAYYKDKQ